MGNCCCCKMIDQDIYDQRMEVYNGRVERQQVNVTIAEEVNYDDVPIAEVVKQPN